MKNCVGGQCVAGMISTARTCCGHGVRKRERERANEMKHTEEKRPKSVLEYTSTPESTIRRVCLLPTLEQIHSTRYACQVK